MHLTDFKTTFALPIGFDCLTHDHAPRHHIHSTTAD